MATKLISLWLCIESKEFNSGTICITQQKISGQRQLELGRELDVTGSSGLGHSDLTWVSLKGRHNNFVPVAGRVLDQVIISG